MKKRPKRCRPWSICCWHRFGREPHLALRTHPEVVQQVVDVNPTIRDSRRIGVTEQVVKAIYIDAAMNELAQLRVRCLFSREQIGNRFRVFGAVQST